jgi:hypothetical protein
MGENVITSSGAASWSPNLFRGKRDFDEVRKSQPNRAAAIAVPQRRPGCCSAGITGRHAMTEGNPPDDMRVLATAEQALKPTMKQGKVHKNKP